MYMCVCMYVLPLQIVAVGAQGAGELEPVPQRESSGAHDVSYTRTTCMNRILAGAGTFTYPE